MASTNKIKTASVTQLNNKKEQNVKSIQKAYQELKNGTGSGVARTETGRKLDALNDSTEVRAAWNAAYEQAQAAAEKEYRDIAVREAYAQRKNQELRRTLNMLGYKIPEDMTTVGQAVAGNAAKAQRDILGFNTKEDILAARLGGAQGLGATAAARAADNPLIRAAAEASARNASKMGQTANDIETLMRERYNSTREAVPYAYQTENGQFVYNEDERKELAERKRLQDRAPREYFQTVEKLHGNTKQTLTDKEKTMSQEDVEGFRKMLHDHGVITELNQYIDPTNSYGDETLRTYISKINNLMTDQEKNAAWYILKNDGAETYRAYIDSKWDELMARERQQEDKDIQEWAKEHPGRSSLEALAQMFEGAGAAALTYGTRFIQGFREGVYGDHPEQDPWEQRAGIKSNVTIDRNDIANRAVEQAGIRLGSDAGRFGSWVGNKAENAVNSLGEKTGVEAEDVYKVIDAVKGAKDWAAGKVGLRKEDGGETEQKSAYAKPVDWTQLRRSGHGLGKDLGVAQAASEAGKGLFNTAFELVRSAMAQRLFGDAGTVVSGLTSMVSTFNEAYDRGATSDQALALGSIDGMLEIYTESATFENLRDAYTGRLDDMPGRIVRAALSEGSEEFASAALGMMADMSILGSKSEFDTAVRELMAKGMSEKEAAAKVYHDQAMSVVKDTVMGMLSGTMGQVMATPANVINSIANRAAKADVKTASEAYGKETGKVYRQGYNYDMLPEMYNAVFDTMYESGREGLDWKQVRDVTRGMVDAMGEDAAYQAYKAGVLDQYRIDNGLMTEAEARPQAETEAKSETEAGGETGTKANPSGAVTTAPIAGEANEAEMSPEEVDRLVESFEGTETGTETTPQSPSATAPLSGTPERAGVIAEMPVANGRTEEQRATAPVVGGVVRNYTQKLDRGTRAMIRIMDAVGKKYRIEYEVVDRIPVGANGIYAGGRRMLVSLETPGKAVAQSALHETVHYVAQNDMDGYMVLEDYVRDALKRHGQDLDALARDRKESYRKQGVTLSTDDAMEEVVAETVPQVLTDEQAVRTLIGEQPGMARRILEHIENFLGAVKDAIRKYANMNNRQEIAALWGQTEDLRNIAEILRNGLERADEKTAPLTARTETRTTPQSPAATAPLGRGALENAEQEETSDSEEKAETEDVYDEEEYTDDERADFNMKVADAIDEDEALTNAIAVMDPEEVNRFFSERINPGMTVEQAVQMAREMADAAYTEEERDAFRDKVMDAINEDYGLAAEFMLHMPPEEVKRFFNERINPGMTVEQAVAMATEMVYGVTTSESGESAYYEPKYSYNSFNRSQYHQNREEAAKALAKGAGVSVKDALRYIDNMESIAAEIGQDRNRLDYTPAELYDALKKNSEYKWTVDFSTLCKKRLIFTGTFDAIQEAFPDMILDENDIINIRKMMMERGYQVACAFCYVESRRKHNGEIIQQFLDIYKEALEGNGEMELGPSNRRAKKKVEKGFMPTIADFNTTEGFENIMKNHKDVLDAYMYFMNARGTSKPKLIETMTDYRDDILKKFKSRNSVNAMNRRGGLRLQSYSDFQTLLMLDMMQVITDMSRVGLKSQAYTKVPDFARVFGATGVKINMSLVAKEVDKDGNIVYDDVEGMPHEEAFKIRDMYSENVGTILVAGNDAVLRAAMKDPKIDFIIPYHRSGWTNENQVKLGIADYTDFSKGQTEKEIATGLTAKKPIYPSDYWWTSLSGDENAQRYLKLCKERGLKPKFEEYSQESGYWKMLIDFKMYDNNGKGAPQMAVKPNFNMQEALRIMHEYDGKENHAQVAQDVVDEWKKILEKRRQEQSTGVKLSLNNQRPVEERDFSWDELTAKPDMELISINTDINIQRTDAIAEGVKNVKTYADRVDSMGTPMMYVDDLGKYVSVGKRAIGHGLDRRVSMQASVASKIGDILKNSIVINAAAPKRENMKSTWIMLGAARTKDNRLVLVRSIINQSNAQLEDVAAFYSALGKKEGTSRITAAASASGNAESELHPSDSRISIQELLGHVKGYFDDVISKDVAEHLGIERSKSEFSARLRFSLNEESPVVDQAMAEAEGMAETEEDPEEAARRKRMRQRYNALKGTPYGEMLRAKQKMGPVAKKLISEWRSKADVGQVRERLQALSDELYLNGYNPEAYRQAVEIARDVLEQGGRENPVPGEYEYLKDYIKSNPMVIEGRWKDEIKHLYDNIGTFRAMTHNLYRFTTDRKSKHGNNQDLDSWLEDMNQIAGNMFDDAYDHNDVIGSLQRIADMLYESDTIKFDKESLDQMSRWAAADICADILEQMGAEGKSAADRIRENTDTIDPQGPKAGEQTGGVLADMKARENEIKGLQKEVEKLTAQMPKAEDYKRQAADMKAREKEIKGLQKEVEKLTDQMPKAEDYKRQAAELKQIKANWERLMNQVRQEETIRIRSEQRKSFDKVASDLREARANNDTEATRRIMGEYRETMKKVAGTDIEASTRMAYNKLWTERVDRAKTYERVEKSANSLKRMLTKPDKMKHIPQELQPMIASMLNGIELTRTGNSTVGSRQFKQQMKGIVDFLTRQLDRQTNPNNTEETPVWMTMCAPQLQQLYEAVETVNSAGKSFATMTLEELQAFSQALTMINHIVNTVNETWKNARYQTVEALGEKTLDDMEAMRDNKAQNTVFKGLDDFLNVNNLDAGSFFERTGEAGSSVYKELADGQAKAFEVIREESERIPEILGIPEGRGKAKRIHEIRGWTREKHQVEVMTLDRRGRTGTKTITLSGTQLMELYALSLREQGMQHLTTGGFQLEGNNGKLGDRTICKMNEATIAAAVSQLTADQKKTVERMQEHLSTDVARRGNEVYYRLYLYNLFNEEHYWPIRIAPGFGKTKAQDGNMVFNALLNSGFMKNINEKATQPIVIGDAIETFCGHVSDMATMVGLAEPVEDLRQWLNYAHKDENGAVDNTDTVKLELERVIGKQGIAYVQRLMDDLNGMGKQALSVGGKLLRNYKIAAITGKLRVVLQQPTAILRASAVMNPKYVTAALTRGKGAKTIKEMQAHSSLAWWKSNGNYEIGTGKSMKSILTGMQDSRGATFMEKIGAPAGVADDIGWATIWQAVKMEVRHERPKLQPGTDAFWQAVDERFREVCMKTQVVDTVLTRSEIMRSKDTFSKMTTAFMSEPTKNINLIRNALGDMARAIHSKDGAAKKKAFGRLAMGTLAVVISQMANAAMTAWHDMLKYWNPDDEDEEGNPVTRMDMFLDGWVEDMVDGVNPLANIPIVKDAWGAYLEPLLRGETVGNVERMDMSALGKLAKAVQKLRSYTWDGNKAGYTAWAAIKPTVTGIGDILGLPVSGLIADAELMLNIINPGTTKTYEREKDKEVAYQLLYEAMANGNTAEFERRWANLEKGQFGQEPMVKTDIQAAIARKLAQNDERIAELYEAKKGYNGGDEVVRLYQELAEAGFDENYVNAALKKYPTLMKAEAKKAMLQAQEDGDEEGVEQFRQTLLDFGVKEATIEGYLNGKDPDAELEEEKATYADYYRMMKAGQKAEAKKIRENLLDNGKTDAEIDKAIAKILAEDDPLVAKAYAASQDLHGMSEQTRLRNQLMNKGYSEDLANYAISQYPSVMKANAKKAMLEAQAAGDRREVSKQADILRSFGVEEDTIKGYLAGKTNEVLDEQKAKYHDLYRAILAGETAEAESMRQNLIDQGKSRDEISKGVAKEIALYDDRIQSMWYTRAGGEATDLKPIKLAMQKEGYTAEEINYAINQYPSIVKSESKDAYIAANEAGDKEGMAAIEKRLESVGVKEETWQGWITGKDLEEELADVPQYYKDNLFAAVRNTKSDTADVKEMVADLIEKSEAADPAKSVASAVAGEFKDEYVQLVKKGQTKQAEAMKKKLVAAGVDETTITKWTHTNKGMGEVMLTGSVEDAKAYVEVMKSISKAADPAATVADNAWDNAKFDYIRMLEEGDTKGAAKAKENLLAVGVKSKTIQNWVNKNSGYKSISKLRSYIDAGDDDAAAKEAVRLTIGNKPIRTKSEVVSYLNDLYYEEYVELMAEGKTKQADRLQKSLENLGLMKSEGVNYFRKDIFDGWWEGYQKSNG